MAAAMTDDHNHVDATIMEAQNIFVQYSMYGGDGPSSLEADTYPIRLFTYFVTNLQSDAIPSTCRIHIL